MRASNYDKRPATKVDGKLYHGWEAIEAQLKAALGQSQVMAIDTYTGIHEKEVIEHLKGVGFMAFIKTSELMKSETQIRRVTDPMLTDDVLFGHVTYLTMKDYFNPAAVKDARQRIAELPKPLMVFGPGAIRVVGDIPSVKVYFDMSRWELQQRFRHHEVNGLGVCNQDDPVSIQYKRGYFNDWRVLDYYKDDIMEEVDYWVDTVVPDDPKMIDADTFFRGLSATATKPFRVVPFFDPAPWGGQWMKEVCDLDPSKANYGWCFDCVPEENSLLLRIDGVDFEMPSQNLILRHSREVLGGRVEARFGKDFPIRFDFLDTVSGGNLSLQVHPTTQFIRQQFGMSYTQDESYYLLDAKEGSTVFLGLKSDVDSKAMLDDLRKAQREGVAFDANKYVNQLPTQARPFPHSRRHSPLLRRRGFGTGNKQYAEHLHLQALRLGSHGSRR